MAILFEGTFPKYSALCSFAQSKGIKVVEEDVVFCLETGAKGRYSPSENVIIVTGYQNVKTLLHELVHWWQYQNGGFNFSTNQEMHDWAWEKNPVWANDPLEQEAVYYESRPWEFFGLLAEQGVISFKDYRELLYSSSI